MKGDVGDSNSDYRISILRSRSGAGLFLVSTFVRIIISAVIFWRLGLAPGSSSAPLRRSGPAPAAALAAASAAAAFVFGVFVVIKSDFHAVDFGSVELVHRALERLFVAELGDAFVALLLVGRRESHLTSLTHEILKVLPTHGDGQVFDDNSEGAFVERPVVSLAPGRSSISVVVFVVSVSTAVSASVSAAVSAAASPVPAVPAAAVVVVVVAAAGVVSWRSASARHSRDGGVVDVDALAVDGFAVELVDGVFGVPLFLELHERVASHQADLFDITVASEEPFQITFPGTFGKTSNIDSILDNVVSAHLVI